MVLVVKNPPINAGDEGSIPGSGRSPGGEHGKPLQYSCLEMDSHGKMDSHGRCLPWTEEPDGLQSMGVTQSWTGLKPLSTQEQPFTYYTASRQHRAFIIMLIKAAFSPIVFFFLTQIYK